MSSVGFEPQHDEGVEVADPILRDEKIPETSPEISIYTREFAIMVVPYERF